MIIDSFELDRRHDNAVLTFDGLDRGLNLFVGPRGGGKSSAHSLLSSAIYGSARAPQEENRLRLQRVNLLIRDGDPPVSIDSTQPGAAEHLRPVERQHLPWLRLWYCVAFTGHDMLAPKIANAVGTTGQSTSIPATELDPCDFCNRRHTTDCDFYEHASAYLERITNRAIVKIRPTLNTGRFEVLTEAGKSKLHHSLTPAGRDMARLSLTLAMADRSRECGVNLPLLLDEPFRHLGKCQAHMLAHVLRDFARAGQQVVAFADDSGAIWQCDELASCVREMAQAHARCRHCNCTCHAADHENEPHSASTIAADGRESIDVVANDADDGEIGIEPPVFAADQYGNFRSLVRDHFNVSGKRSEMDATAESSDGESGTRHLLADRDGQKRQVQSSTSTSTRSVNHSTGETNCPRSHSNDRDSSTLCSARSDGNSSKSINDQTSNTSNSGTDDDRLRWYLNPSDPVVDAPEIGPKMAERLHDVGIDTIDDLLKADAADVTKQLNHRRTNADTVRRWQQQTRLVCQVPQLRGHDAQILVACDIIEPMQLASRNPHELFDKVGPFSKTKKGARILRAGQPPDLNEVTDWISWAGSARTLNAA